MFDPALAQKQAEADIKEERRPVLETPTRGAAKAWRAGLEPREREK